MLYVASDPPAQLVGNQLVWQLTGLPGGGAQAVRATFRVPSAGVVMTTALVQTADGLKSEAQATTRVAIAQLQARINGPTSVSPGEPQTLDVEVTNPGTGPATGVKLRADFDPSLEHESRANPLEVNIGTLQANQTQNVPLTLTPRQSGRPAVRIMATADGNLRQDVTHTLSVTQRALTFALTGSPTRFVNRLATWDVQLVNASELPMDGVQVRVQVPDEVSFRAATGGGQLVGGQVVWPIGSLRPRERRDLQLTLTPVRPSARVALVGTAAADKVPEQRAETVFEVQGMAALRIEVAPPAGPVEVGRKAVYTIRVLNQGTLAAKQIAVSATLQPAVLPRFATGPTLNQLQGERVDFAPLGQIEAGQAVEYRIEGEAKQAGEARLSVEVRSDASPTPMVSEQATQVVVPSQPR
jgi:hypothetical protein